MTWVGEHREKLLLASRQEAIRQVPGLPSPAAKKIEQQAHQSKQTPDTDTKKDKTTVFCAEPPPIMKLAGSSENAFRPTEVLPYEPIDIASQPLVTKPAHRNSTVKLGYKTNQDAQAVTEDEALAIWIERQAIRQGTKR